MEKRERIQLVVGIDHGEIEAPLGPDLSVEGDDRERLITPIQARGMKLVSSLPARTRMALRKRGLRPQGWIDYYTIQCEQSDTAEAMRRELLGEPRVAAAFTRHGRDGFEEMVLYGKANFDGPIDPNKLFKTPNYLPKQGYLESAPGGVGAIHAWQEVGGRGEDVTIVDVERGWRHAHEDLTSSTHLSGALPPTNEGDDWARYEHGTAVLGILGARDNGFGVTGIAPRVLLKTVSTLQDEGSIEPNYAKAIYEAASRLEAGDILLVEIQSDSTPQQKYIPIEWFHDVYQAIRVAVDMGIVVVAAAGNGDEDLDSDVYDLPPPGSPASWRNPLKRIAADSGSIIVGAGCPPNAPAFGPDRSRIIFPGKGASNYGSAVDAQGWGANIVTTGMGDAWGSPPFQNRYYTESFGLTSGASPMVAGVLACVQGFLRSAAVQPLTSLEARALLRGTGSPQTPAPQAPLTQRIGNRPDLVQLIAGARELRGL